MGRSWTTCFVQWLRLDFVTVSRDCEKQRHTVGQRPRPLKTKEREEKHRHGKWVSLQLGLNLLGAWEYWYCMFGPAYLLSRSCPHLSLNHSNHSCSGITDEALKAHHTVGCSVPNSRQEKERLLMNADSVLHLLDVLPSKLFWEIKLTTY